MTAPSRTAPARRARTVKQFCADYPKLRRSFPPFLERTRKNWQNKLADFRNRFLEHQMDDRSDFEDFYKTEMLTFFSTLYGARSLTFARCF